MKIEFFFFKNKTQQKSTLWRKTGWLAPEPENIKLKTYFLLTENEINKYKNKLEQLNLKKNLTFDEQNSLKSLKINKNIIIKKSDKGNSIVLMNKKDYKNKVFTHLNDKTSYQQQSSIINFQNAITFIKSYIEALHKRNLISGEVFKYIKPPCSPKLSTFYILPKIHKVNIPGRPIVSSINSVTQNISEFLSVCLQPLIPKLKSYIKDTNHFLKKTMKHGKINENTILISADITSLYTNIPHKEGIEACIYFIEKYRSELPKFVPNKTILHTLFLFVLENNYFEFDKQIYKQLFGTAMGTKMAPPYANLFLGYLEEKQIYHSKHFNNITKYLRFLDDIFIIW